jgi:hypothetical protein
MSTEKMMQRSCDDFHPTFSLDDDRALMFEEVCPQQLIHPK